MPPTSRRKNTSVAEALIDSPQLFEFLQALRLLEIAGGIEYKKKQPSIGSWLPPAQEFITFKHNHSLSFAQSDLNRISQRSDKSASGNDWLIETNCIGASGAQGALPLHYTEFLLERAKAKDYSMKAFLDLFHHRQVSLYYRASRKYSLPLSIEENRVFRDKRKTADTRKTGYDRMTQSLLSICGMGFTGMQNRLSVSDDTIANYSGLFSQTLRTPSGLKHMLADFFGVPVDVASFVGEWQTLIKDVRTRLGSQQHRQGQNAKLGCNAMLGSRGWFAQGKIRVKIGPLREDQLETFAPGTTALRQLNELTHLYLGVATDYEFEISVRSQDISRSSALGSGKSTILGWSSWLVSKQNKVAAPDSLVRIRVHPGSQ